jgi:hypothetical protein
MIQSPFLRILGSAADPRLILYKRRANCSFLRKTEEIAFIAAQVGGISHQQLGGSANCMAFDDSG